MGRNVEDFKMKFLGSDLMASFQEKVHKVVSKIPCGKTMTYKEVAYAVGRSKAYRAVGNVLKKNFNSAIPCHRVVRSDGQPGGYNRGRNHKKILLKKESDI